MTHPVSAPSAREWTRVFVVPLDESGGGSADLERCIAAAAAAGSLDEPVFEETCPLHRAVELSLCAVVRRLLEAGANPNRPTGLPPEKKGVFARLLPLSLATRSVDHCCKMTELLLAFGANPRLVDPLVPCPVLCYAISECMGCARRILDAGGFVPGSRNARGFEPVFHDMALALKETEVNQWPPSPRRPEHWEGVATRLAELGADPDALNAEGRSPHQVLALHDRQCHVAVFGSSDRSPVPEGAVTARWRSWRETWALRQRLTDALPLGNPRAARGRL